MISEVVVQDEGGRDNQAVLCITNRVISRLTSVPLGCIPAIHAGSPV